MYAAVVASASVLVLTACGTDDGSVADDPGPSEATSTTPSSAPTDEPTAEPTVGTYPPFEPQNYSFQLSVACFCAGAGVPIEVTVEGGSVVDAVYVADDTGRSAVKEGDPADKVFWLTINDIIDAANNTRAARVDVVWPPGQDYPSSVYVDQDERTIDEEVGYTVSNVEVA
jgi:ABC-type glycerol-3-phosphate transport system substrate-binding protein